MLPNCAKPFRIILTLALLSLVAALASKSVKAGEPPSLASGWSWRVFQSGLRLVDNIVAVNSDTLYVTLEQSPGEGQLVKLINVLMQTPEFQLM